MAKNLDLNKLEELVLEINDQFRDLKESKGALEILQLELLEATTNYLSANISVFRKKLSSKDLPSIEGDSEVIENAEIVEIVEPLYEHEVDNQVDDLEIDVLIKDEDESSFVQDLIFEDTSSVINEVDTDSEESIDPVIDQVEPMMDRVRVEETDAIEEVEISIPSDPILEDVETEIIQVEPIEIHKNIEPDRPKTLNEMIGIQRQTQESAWHQTNIRENRNAIDLKTAISLNDKLMFIKDLFNGYSLAYSEAIEILNRFEDLASADAFLQANYALKNSWSEKQESVDKFYIILNKKFQRY